MVEPIKQAIAHARAGKRVKAREVLLKVITGLWNDAIPGIEKFDPALAGRLKDEAQMLRGYGRELKPEPPRKIAEMLESDLPYAKELQTELIFSTRRP